MSDLISRQVAIDVAVEAADEWDGGYSRSREEVITMKLRMLPSVQPEQEDYTDMKVEFLRMASYIDVILECSDEQKETLIGFISRLAEYMPWAEKD